RMAESRALYQESSAAAPEVVQTWLGWARLEEADRNVERAGELLDRAEKLAPGNPSIVLSRAVIFGREGAYAEALTTLDSMAPAPAPGAAGGGNGSAPAGSGNGSAPAGGGLGANELLEKGRLL